MVTKVARGVECSPQDDYDPKYTEDQYVLDPQEKQNAETGIWRVLQTMKAQTGGKLSSKENPNGDASAMVNFQIKVLEDANDILGTQERSHRDRFNKNDKQVKELLQDKNAVWLGNIHPLVLNHFMRAKGTFNESRLDARRMVSNKPESFKFMLTNTA
ncbi:hypothetical protein scyTo_0004365 [Scyliorhinus torazame]|uniref:Uncharacterized protein n=1 Tax=Scyliorhinus torazame TaxID=75743 RepID=A0A401NQL1_SCYTO|nr:hypothetical protein [Scyliorhinus torazame]